MTVSSYACIQAEGTSGRQEDAALAETRAAAEVIHRELEDVRAAVLHPDMPHWTLAEIMDAFRPIARAHARVRAVDFEAEFLAALQIVISRVQ